MNRTHKTELYLNYYSKPEPDTMIIYSDNSTDTENAIEHIALNNDDIKMIAVYVDGISTARLFKYYDGSVQLFY